MNVHPVADLFPMLTDDELAELAADIRQRGLLHPVVLDGQGRVLDGRNRLAACEIAGVEPMFVTYEGEDPDGYALAVNIARRHLTTGARAIVAAKAARLNGGTQRKIAADTNLYQARIGDAATVLDWAPDLVPEILAGARPLSTAVEAARDRKREAEDLKTKLDRLRASAPDLAVPVDEERMGVDDAIAALNAREDKAQAEQRQRAEEAAARARRISESLRMAVNTLTKAFGTEHLREQAAEVYVPAAVASEVNQNITSDDLRAAADICDDLAKRWEQR